MTKRFTINATDGQARAGCYETAHGSFETPNFMPVGTQASVKGVSPRVLKELGAQIILSNTYHLHLRPGDEVIKNLGGLHEFMNWDGPILTDSGGYQVFSLAKLNKITDEGVAFQSHIDGSRFELTPEKVVQIQENLGVDIMMLLDVCPPFPAAREVVEEAVRRTSLWAEKSLQAKTRDDISAFGIVQGGVFEDLRLRSLEELIKLELDAYAIGGVSVGEPIGSMRETTSFLAPKLPGDKIRYLMGVGTPEDLVSGIGCGVDLFDCVIPTRSARFGRLYVDGGHINIRNQKYRSDEQPLMSSCDCYTCKSFSRAYLAHLVHAEEVLAIELCSIHNLRFYERLMEDCRAAITEGRYSEFSRGFLRDIDGPEGQGV